MQVVSLKDYAKNNNISYEAVRKQVNRYADELGEHIIKDGRQQFLDGDAVSFLDAKRKKNPVVIYQANKDEEIERLQKEKEALLLKLAAVQDQLIRIQEENNLLKDEKREILQLQADNEAERKKAEERATAAERAAETAEQISQAYAQEASEAKKEASDLKDQNDSLWGRLEKVKNRTLIERILNKGFLNDGKSI